ncbi:UDP-N-acetylmuramoyl-L-alanine--D-glutamate ligase [Treponema sp.]|uniref:UDP-N-acetylmuramoyl-L-alanine--D-glutamate ligase n=1 Tax=Treponema sp. TaxID=166 RepID=UPI0025E6D387|nr:UDP-N-acetylmuramoyl-L-alanine--D-glutamate ligase [Treponema sp.]MCR5218633.1 UDP-N-acetylmuramoyl-L-alanine--D-glutamate ligase [Treponema sp.]
MTAHVYPEGCTFNTLEDIKSKHITVMGLGLNGGGEACVRFFLKHGALVTVTDMKTAEQLKPTIDSLNSDKSLPLNNLRYVLGEHKIEDFENADCVIKNPGVKFNGNKYLAAARHIETDISIFLHFTKAPIIAVTGSKGKSSTVSAIDYGLRTAGFRSFLGGNITVSPLTFLEETDGTTPVVLELSSWQLADLRGRKALKPKIAVITKIVPDHQNWYSDMDSYVDDKKLIYADQDENDFTILDGDEDDYLKDSLSPKPGCKCWGDLFASETKAKVLRYSTSIQGGDFEGVYQKKTQGHNVEGIAKLSKELRSTYAKTHNLAEEKIMGELFVPGDHMKINVLNASLVLHLMGVAPEQIISILGSWKGIPHRLERFHEWECPSDSRKIIFYNDSCATVPEAAAAASQSFNQKVVLITGGTDKNLDFLPLAKTLNGENSTEYIPLEIYLLSGTGTDKLTSLLDERKIKYSGPFDSLEVLLGILKNSLMSRNAENIYGRAHENQYLPVVFSPGCTSFGMFSNEFDRGNKFKDYVKNIF